MLLSKISKRFVEFRTLPYMRFETLESSMFCKTIWRVFLTYVSDTDVLHLQTFNMACTAPLSDIEPFGKS